jgi:hypothetical protein
MILVKFLHSKGDLKYFVHKTRKSWREYIISLDFLGVTQDGRSEHTKAAAWELPNGKMQLLAGGSFATLSA